MRGQIRTTRKSGTTSDYGNYGGDFKRKNSQTMYVGKCVKRMSGLHLHGNEDADELEVNIAFFPN